MVFVVGCLVAIIVISIFGYLWDQGGKPSSDGQATRSASPPQSTQTPPAKTPVKDLQIMIKTRDQSGFKVEMPPRQLGYSDLKGRFMRVEGGHATLGLLWRKSSNVFKTHTIKSFQSSTKITKPTAYLLQSLASWIIAIEKDNKLILLEDGGPYLLLHRQDPTKSILRVSKIEAV